MSFLTTLCPPQTEKMSLEEENRSKDELVAEMEAEALQIPQYKSQLEQVIVSLIERWRV